MNKIEVAPIILFVYNRPWHTQQTVEALQKNELADESELFIYSDAPKNEHAIENVARVREYIKTIEGFKKVTIIERAKNWGLADSIIDGVTRTVNDYGRVIVLEDDLVTSPYFLRFMNEGLEYYKDVEKVMHIAGYIYPLVTDALPDTFFLKPTSCWGWATWARSWKYFKKNTDELLEFFTEDMRKDFNLGNSYNYFAQIELNKKGLLNTWAIYWYASVFLKGGLSLHPRISFVKNIGHDGSGVHCGESLDFDTELANVYHINFESKIDESLTARQALIEYFNSIKIPLWRRVIGKTYGRLVGALKR